MIGSAALATYLVIFTGVNHEDDGGNAVKTMNPLLPLVALENDTINIISSEHVGAKRKVRANLDTWPPTSTIRNLLSSITKCISTMPNETAERMSAHSPWQTILQHSTLDLWCGRGSE